MNIKEISFSVIVDKYYLAQYDNITLIIDMKTGYVNITKLCNFLQNEENKPVKFSEWFKRSYDIVNEIAISTNRNKSEIFYGVVDHESIDVLGIYVHSEIIIHVVYWASIKFAVKINKLIVCLSIKMFEKESKVKTLPSAQKNLTEYVFAIYKNMQNTYRVVRCQSKGLYQAEIRCKNVGYTKQIYIHSSTYAYNLWDTVKQNIPQHIGFISNGYYIHLVATEKELINYIERTKNVYF